ncbi:MAG: hypothetical protein KFB93_06320 [Simkaniaceae bacterium]|nr:MAG: hypothetical protein KFB93_06320 [Simkaniaceae bacterium]
MSISSFFSLSNTFKGGLGSTLSTWVLSQTGVIEDISKATTPFFKGAFVFGATTGTIEFATNHLKEKVKNNVAEDSPYRQGIDWVHSALVIGTRYAVAKVGSQFFGLNISNKYVHLLMASEFLSCTTSSSRFGQAFNGVMGIMYAKTLSIFIKGPLAENAFYFGAISGSAYSLLGKVTPLADSQVKGRVEDLRYLFIYRAVLCGGLTSASLYLAGKVCRSLSIDIPKGYLNGVMALSIPSVLLYSTFSHLSTDILGSLKAQQINDRLKASENHNVQAIHAKIQEMIDWASPNIDSNALQGHLKNHPVMKAELPKLFNSELAGVFSQFVQGWSEGIPPEDLVVRSAERLGNQVDHIMPILEVVSEAIGVKENKAGAEFILKVVLYQASSPVLVAFKEMDVEFIPLLLTKAVAIFAVDNTYAAQDLPPFFTAKTKEKIIALRQLLLENSATREEYRTVLTHLNSVVQRDSNEGFFSFEAELSREESEALNALKIIGNEELQSGFIKTCAAQATKRIVEVD